MLYDSMLRTAHGLLRGGWHDECVQSGRALPGSCPPSLHAQGSLVLLFETRVGMTNAEADAQFAIWSGVCYVTPLLGGWIADSYLGERGDSTRGLRRMFIG